MRQFFDTNVLVYAHDARHAGKRDLSRSLVGDALDHDEFVVSTQVLVEFYATATRRGLLAWAEALDLVLLWSGHEIVNQTPALVANAIALHRDHSVSFWDALIVQAALDARCDVLLSEDLQHGRRFGELEVRNPFVAPAAHEKRGRYRASRRARR